jgi:hypothetical protein
LGGCTEVREPMLGRSRPDVRGARGPSPTVAAGNVRRLARAEKEAALDSASARNEVKRQCLGGAWFVARSSTMSGTRSRFDPEQAGQRAGALCYCAAFAPDRGAAEASQLFRRNARRSCRGEGARRSRSGGRRRWSERRRRGRIEHRLEPLALRRCCLAAEQCAGADVACVGAGKRRRRPEWWRGASFVGAAPCAVIESSVACPGNAAQRQPFGSRSMPQWPQQAALGLRRRWYFVFMREETSGRLTADRRRPLERELAAVRRLPRTSGRRDPSSSAAERP